MDFYQISSKELKDGTVQIYPEWIVGRSNDLMVQGRSFYAIWDEERGLWSRDEYDVQRLVDADLHRYVEKIKKQGLNLKILSLRAFNNNAWTSFRKFVNNISDNSHPLDEKLTFSNTKVKKTDYVSKKLPYSLERGPTHAWDELLSVLYLPEEQAKIEWAIGSIISGESKNIHKFVVFYGPAGSGKSTILNIIQKLFSGYTTTFDARALGSNNNSFATEAFRSNPLVAIQHDGDLSKIEDNTKLNSIISHEDMTVNEKFKPTYTSKINAFLFMGTNQPVKISDAKSGIIRRLIDVTPTGNIIEASHYYILMEQINFELGAIAYKCLQRYSKMGKNYYDNYKPIEMMLQTDVFYNFVEANYDIFKRQDGISLRQAYQLFKEYCLETNIEKVLPQYKFREELRNYFEHFHDRIDIDGKTIRSYYSGFKSGLSSSEVSIISADIVFEKIESIFDSMYKSQPAQYARPSGVPGKAWNLVDTKLTDIDTSKLHFVKVPKNHIVIDFDLVDEDGEKDFERNLHEASKWPSTYSEISKSGKGIHLHYIYKGDVEELASVYDVGIEVKTLLGDSSLRRKLTLCNNKKVAEIAGGLPKKEKRMLSVQQIKSEKSLRELIERNLRKEIHPGTKPSVDFIYTILEEVYSESLSYDVSDLKPIIFAFAAKSTNQSHICIKKVQEMKFISKDKMTEISGTDSESIVFFDVEVYQNLLVVCWKYIDSDTVVKMVNPDPIEIEKLFSLKLVGFNNRRYDNHILYARYLGYSLEELYLLSQKIIANNPSALFGEAYNLSYTDIYDFSSKKQGLKKFQIELGIYHLELDIPWDKPVDEGLWPKVIEYCANDVISTEAVFKARQQDFVARKILSSLSGLSVNNTTQAHTAKIIFGEDKHPQRSFIYTNLSEEFPGYIFDGKTSTYRGEITGEGGYVYAEPGIYEDVSLLDIASMHPVSIEVLNLFGPYTKNFSALKEARLAIKHKQYEKAKKLLDGKLSEFLGDDKDAEELSYALKIIINIVYGLTSARFDNPFRDNRNIDNIVAKRGALFMVDLKKAVQELGQQVIHIKTDSIKIPKASPDVINFIFEFGKKYGYDFEYESKFDKMCLVNDAVYIAKEKDSWTAVGAQFQHPYVFKTLFSKEEIVFDDFFETKNVIQGVMYLDFSNSDSVDGMTHVGRTGSFIPVINDGGHIWRVKEDKKYAVAGTKGYLWIDREMAKYRESLGTLQIDMSYFENLAQNAKDAISKFGSFEDFVS